jgi:hypothetical protein
MNAVRELHAIGRSAKAEQPVGAAANRTRVPGTCLGDAQVLWFSGLPVPPTQKLAISVNDAPKEPNLPSRGLPLHSEFVKASELTRKYPRLQFLRLSCCGCRGVGECRVGLRVAGADALRSRAESESLDAARTVGLCDAQLGEHRIQDADPEVEHGSAGRGSISSWASRCSRLRV